MKNFTILFLCCCATVSVWAHGHDHGTVSLKKWFISAEKKTVEGSFLMMKDHEVYLEDAHHQVLHYPISAFSAADQDFVKGKNKHIEHLNQEIVQAATLFGTDPAYIDSAFIPFKPDVNTRWDNTYFYVESKGIPSHPMMSGITSWQQQVPIPQCYIGANAWSIPLNPVLAATPVPVNAQHFLRGAIAVAANGVAIFNPYTNQSTNGQAAVEGLQLPKGVYLVKIQGTGFQWTRKIMIQ